MNIIGEYRKATIKHVVKNSVNIEMFLPALQRHYVWDKARICKLFDSILRGYPIGTFMCYIIRGDELQNWDVYKFLSELKEYNKNERAVTEHYRSLALVLDGQQRLTSLYVGLCGSIVEEYRGNLVHKYLYMDLLHDSTKQVDNDNNLYAFEFRENDKGSEDELWFKVPKLLSYSKTYELRNSIDKSNLTEEQKNIVDINIEQLFNAVNVDDAINWFEIDEATKEDITEIFVRINSSGVKLEYSDILLSTATSRWSKFNAREEFETFTDRINKNGTFEFSKDFVLKGALYLTPDVPIKYNVSSFTPENLLKIEEEWASIKASLMSAVDLIDNLGFSNNNLVTKNAILPIAYYLKYFKKKRDVFVSSTLNEDIKEKSIIRKWLIISTIKNAFGGSGDTILERCRKVINSNNSVFPAEAILKELGVSTALNEEDIFSNRTNYGNSFCLPVLMLMQEDSESINKVHLDHIFPKSTLTKYELQKRGIDEQTAEEINKTRNSIANIQLLTGKENMDKSDMSFEEWISSRNESFKKSHLIPEMGSYRYEDFLIFIEERKKLMVEAIKNIKI